MTKPENAALAVLHEAQRQGQNLLSRTMLVKLVYLLDTYHAAENAGLTWTGWRWKFQHFGPFAGSAVESLDQLVDTGVLSQAEGHTAKGDHKYTLYKIGPRGKAPTLREIGVSTQTAFKIAADIRRFQNDLPGMLDYVYFGTAPMDSALPGAELRFDTCIDDDFQQYKPIPMKPLPKNRVQEFRDRMKSKLAQEQKGTDDQPLYDEIYHKAMEALDGEVLPTGVQGHANIRISDGDT